jgi:hypothetical protein
LIKIGFIQSKDPNFIKKNEFLFFWWAHNLSNYKINVIGYYDKDFKITGYYDKSLKANEILQRIKAQ